MLLNASRHNMARNYDLLHDDFDRALDYIVEKAGNINVYDIRIDGDYAGIFQYIFRIASTLLQRLKHRSRNLRFQP